MVTLLLRLAGPLQAWGTNSKFETRCTQREPSKSGVIGLIAAAMGRKRDEPLDDLISLRFGVRIDQEGTILNDFHTARHPAIKKRAFVTNRNYLENGCFLVGLEGDEIKLREIDEAIKRPFYPLFLGRRSCPPSGRISLGVRDKGLCDALRDEPWQASEWYKKQAPRNVHLEIISDVAPEDASALVTDIPVSFDQECRKYCIRGIKRTINGKIIHNDESKARLSQNNSFDVMAEIRKEVD